MSHEFQADAARVSGRRNRMWYHQNLMKVLEEAKEKRVRDIDVSIALAKQLIEILDEPRDKPKEVLPREVVPSDDDSLMTPIDPETLKILYGRSKGGTERYLHARNKKSPEEKLVSDIFKFYFRIVSSWDYGWQQKQSRLLGRDINRGRCAILRDTFYRKNNLAPDNPHVAQPAGGEVSICTQYQCNAN